MKFLKGSEKVYECDLVLLAMGFLGPEEACIQQLNLKKDSRTNIETPIGKYNTSINKIYAAGGILNNSIFSLLFIFLSILFRLSSWTKSSCLGKFHIYLLYMNDFIKKLYFKAIHEGRQAARQIDHDLMGFSTLAGPAGVLAAEMIKRKQIVS